MKTLKLFAMALVAIVSCQSALAYRWSVTNGTDKDIYVDIWGMAKIGGTMFYGHKWAATGQGDEDASRLQGPQLIKAKSIRQFNFSYWEDIGICFGKILAGPRADYLQELDVKWVNSSSFNRIQNAVSGFGEGLSEASKAAGTIEAEEAQIAAATGEISGALLSGATKAAAGSLCDHFTFLIGKDKKGNLIVVGKR